MTRLATLLIGAVVMVAAASSLEAWEYVVAPGDTMSQIAKTQLGSARRWKEIAELNNIRPPYSLRPGDKLTMPGDGAASEPDDMSDGMVWPVDPQTAVQTWPQAGLSWGSFGLSEPIWVWGIVGLLVFWTITAICLHAGCWFSLVEAPFMRCAFLAMLQAGLLMLFLLVMCFIDSMTTDQHKSGIVWYAMMVLVELVHISLLVIVTKRVLDCKWRSVLTVFVMAHFVTITLAIGVVLTLQLIISAIAA